MVIIGGGLTGCATAYACAAAGLRPVLIERDRIGLGSAGRGAGLLLPDPDPPFRDVVAAHGLRTARRVFEAWRDGAREAAALLRRLNVRCALEPLDVLVTADREGETSLRREHDARAAAGFDLAWLAPKAVKRATNRDLPAAMRMRGAFGLDPYRACLGLAAAAAARRAASSRSRRWRRSPPGARRSRSWSAATSSAPRRWS